VTMCPHCDGVVGLRDTRCPTCQLDLVKARTDLKGALAEVKALEEQERTQAEQERREAELAAAQAQQADAERLMATIASRGDGAWDYKFITVGDEHLRDTESEFRLLGSKCWELVCAMPIAVQTFLGGERGKLLFVFKRPR